MSAIVCYCGYDCCYCGDSGCPECNNAMFELLDRMEGEDE